MRSIEQLMSKFDSKYRLEESTGMLDQHVPIHWDQLSVVAVRLIP